MRPLGKRIMLGALIAVGGAFTWALIVSITEGTKGGPLFVIPLTAGYAVLITSWFVLPMGGVIGAAMPSVVRACSGRAAFLRGALLGICAGILASGLTALFMEWPRLRDVRDQFVPYFATMTPLCAFWVGVWAFRWREKPNNPV